MIQTFYVILPLILMVAIGQIATRSGRFTKSDWIGIEKLSFQILLPALLIKAIVGSDLSLEKSGFYGLSILIAFTVAGALTMALRMLPKSSLDNAALSSLFQAATRWNGLITLTIADQVFPDNGLIIVTVAMGLMIPVINISNIIAVSSLNARDFSVMAVTKNILKNPLIIGCAVGISLNLTGTPLPDPILQTLDYISRGALAVGLLAVGAGFSIRRLLVLNWRVLWAISIKFIVAPMIAWISAAYFGLGPVETVCAILVVATPTATNGYIIARQMGGDSELYAIILNWQLVVSVVAFPMILALAV